MEKVLLFRMGDAEAAVVADMLAAMKIKCVRIPESAFHLTIGALASGKIESPGARTGTDGVNADRLQGLAGSSGAGVQKTAQGVGDTGAKRETQRESLMVFCDVSEKHFNRALALLRSRAVRVDYKAVLTPVNREWNVPRLYAELAREKAEYERMKG